MICIEPWKESTILFSIFNNPIDISVLVSYEELTKNWNIIICYDKGEKLYTLADTK